MKPSLIDQTATAFQNNRSGGGELPEMEKLKRWLAVVGWCLTFAWSLQAVSAQAGAPAAPAQPTTAASAQNVNAAPTTASSVTAAAPSAASVPASELPLGSADHIL